MIGFLRRAKPQVRSHWYVPMMRYETSVAEFYASIEGEIRERGFPDVEVLRLSLKEAGVISAGREYLRIRRERVLFDVGVGPFGDCLYYSCRGCILPRSLSVFEILLALATLGSFGMLYVISFGMAIGLAVLAATVLAIAALLMQAGRWPGVDDFLVNLPVVGGIYELLFRPETYHRLDTRHMFMDLVNHLVREKVNEDVLARGREEPQFVEVKVPEQPMGYKGLAKDVLDRLMKPASDRDRHAS